MASWLVTCLALLLIQASFTLHFIGEFPYPDLVSFFQEKKICKLQWSNRRPNKRSDFEIQNGTNCLYFFESSRNINWKNTFRITKVNVIFHSYNYEYNFDLEAYSCQPQNDSQDVQSLLMCKWENAKRRAVSCEACSQCTGNVQCEHNAEGKTSRCLQGYVIRNGTCLKETPLSWIHEKDNQLVVVGAGGFTFGVICSSTVLLFIYCRKRKSKSSSTRLHASSIKIDDSHRNTSDDHDEFGNSRENQIVRHTNDENESQPIYNELNESTEQIPNNVYGVSQAMFSGECSADDVYSYNHLHEKDSHLSANIYDVSHTSGSFVTGKNDTADLAKPCEENTEGNV
ncbi:uncharacterized protein LOC125655228 isoform X2 [Ostrea edulis]|uniref:uncharacterized protein LOC125655228 isoform X2 n=1 Tax=Ostrea edulis TaxID=37623 RepID=UPI0024AFC0F0|nr:uncharacterized protein LOC125655228 isoform X2 [Ostrea edulis]